ncbi:MAG: winged helix-turn-helix domain-containing protein [Actinomycetota bacterium]|nr:winged helix-turn-helix domain-containing protein [Actinomycetota bacterium]
MSVPTLLLVGIDQLAQIPEYLDMGAVVVIAPDPSTLRRWRWAQEGEAPEQRGNGSPSAVVVDIAGRRISVHGLPLDLSDLEFRVLAALLSEPRRALSFRDIRRVGWGESLELPLDIYSVRSLIQRLRAKLRALEAPETIEAVRGFGFRAEPIVCLQEREGAGYAYADGDVSRSTVSSNVR